MTVFLIILSVITGILLLAALAFVFGCVKIYIVCREDVSAAVSVFGIRFSLLPKKEKKEKQMKKCTDPHRILKKELRKRKKALKKAKKKRKPAKTGALPGPTPNFKEKFEMIRTLISKIYYLTRGKVTVNVRKMQILVASDDAAKTAVLYGVILQSTAFLLQWMETHFLRIDREDGAIRVEPNYLSEHTCADIDLVCRVRLSTALLSAYRILQTIRKEKRKMLAKAWKRQVENTQKATEN